MQKLPIKKSELTLIESLVENSSEIVRLHNSINVFSGALFIDGQCKSKLIDSTHQAVKALIKERKLRAEELEIHNANMFKAAYSHQYKITFDKLFFSTAEMQAGYVSMYVGNDKSRRRVILFLSDTTPAFLDTIEEGTLVEYTQHIEEAYLPFCKAVWKPNNRRDLYLEHLKLLLK